MFYVDTIFQILYKELYYRHIYAKLQPTIEQRFESWQNYLDLFGFLLSTPPFSFLLSYLSRPCAFDNSPVVTETLSSQYWKEEEGW